MTLDLHGATASDERSATVRWAPGASLGAAGGAAATAAVASGASIDRGATVRGGCRRVSLSIVSGLLRVADCAIVFAAACSAFLLHVAGTGGSLARYALVSLIGSLLAGHALHVSGAYQPGVVRRPLAGFGRIMRAVLAVAAIFVTAGFVTQTSAEWSRLWAALWLGLTVIGLTGARAGLSVLTRRWAETGCLRRDIAVVGAGTEAERLLAHIAAAADPFIRVVGVFDIRPSGTRRTVAGHAVRGCVADLREFIRATPVDEVIVALPSAAEAPLLHVFNQLRCLPVDVRLAPAPIAYHLLSRTVSHLAQLPLLHVADRPLDDWGRVLKGLEDRLLGALILLLIALPMGLIAVAIKVDNPGPVLFRQKRYGLNNQLIEVLKFRTMRHDRCDENGVVSTQVNDPRITRVGAFLRRTSLDELPQFINVLRGEMSIVGPRPHATQTRAGDRLLEEVVAEYAVRHKVKPGITGWAQVNGWRGTIDSVEKLQKRVELDIYYLENWSLMFDLKIIALTLLKGFTGKSAY